jgi:N12 class adenine-specific DNA methylase
MTPIQSTALPAQIFTERINPQQHYVQITYTTLHVRHTIRKGSMDKHFFVIPNKLKKLELFTTLKKL